MGQSTLIGRVLVIRLVWLMGLLLLMGSGSMLFISNTYHTHRAADQVEQIKMQMFMHMEQRSVENTDENYFMKFEKEELIKVDTEESISAINIKNSDTINNNNISYSVNNSYEHTVVTTDKTLLNETEESIYYADPNIKQSEHIEYIYDVDYEEEIQEEIKSVEKQEINKDAKYALTKSTKNKKYKIRKNNKEQDKFGINNKKNENLKCNALPCPVHPPGLLGTLNVPEDINVIPASVSKGIRHGGSWWPLECQARFRVAVVIPYSNQNKQILPFLQHIHGFLQRQQLNYTLFFVQQHGEDTLNHGQLHNVGYLLTKSVGPWDCWVFHDINLLPLDDRHLYHCDPFPRHLSVRTQDIPLFPVNELEFYKAGFGGATMLAQEHMEATNGWSNKFWGSGDDLGKNMKWRLAWQDLPIWRYPPTFANYRNVGNATKPKFMKNIMEDMWVKYMGVKTSDFKNDGLNNTNYKVLNMTQGPLYTNFVVDIGKPFTKQ